MPSKASLNQSFPKRLRLLRRSEYIYVASHTTIRRMGKFLVIEATPNGREYTRCGITATRRFGKAHRRNRFKRIAREAFRQVKLQLPPGLDIVIRPRAQANAASSDIITRELLSLMQR